MNGTIPYEPVTDHGAGVFPPLLRAMTRVISLTLAERLNWPVTNEQAKFELTDAITGLTPAVLGNLELMSEEARTHLHTWMGNVREVITECDVAFAVDPDSPITPIVPQLRELANRTFAIASILDEDLCGLTRPATDPGRTP